MFDFKKNISINSIINYTGLLVAIFFLIGMLSVQYCNYKSIININENLSVDLNSIDINGYKKNGTNFINSIGDANIQFQVN